MAAVAEASKGPLVLLVEDNERNARLITEILTANGYQVLAAGDGAEAVESALVAHPHLILMDLQLPGMDGLTATRTLRENPETAAIPIVALTAHAMPEHRSQLLRAGCCSYITKPISYRPFLEEINRVLGESLAAVSQANREWPS